MKIRMYCLLYFMLHALAISYGMHGGESFILSFLAFVWVYIIGSFTGVWFFFGLILGVNPFDLIEGC